MRVLLLAEQANPEWVSVPLVGWSHARAIAKLCDAHVVTQVRNRAAFLRAGLSAGKDFTAIDNERVARPVWQAAEALGKLGFGWTLKTASQSVPYYDFERRAWKAFGERIRAGEFDIVHRLTPLSPTTPSMIASRVRAAGVPFVWGPINGGVAWPKHFGGVQKAEGEWLSYVRDAYKLMPAYRGTREHASAILVGSSDTLAQMPERYHNRCVYMPENAIDPERFGNPDASAERVYASDQPLRVCFIGRLVPYKGADMLIDAAAPLVQAGRLILDIYGDGPERARLASMIDERALSHGVTLHGHTEHAELRQRLATTEVLAFPSIREFGGAVILEAMALGVVPIVVRYGGPKELVTEASGFLVELDTRERIVAALRATLERLAQTRGVLAAKAIAGRARVAKHFTWDAKARDVLAVYQWVLGQRDKPRPNMPLGDP
jgi:alpha-maltose-1-phosphate synthase